MCRVVIMVVGLVLALVGVVWFFQGIGSLEGSPMTGVNFWAYAGGVVFVLGLGLLALGYRCRPRSSTE